MKNEYAIEEVKLYTPAGQPLHLQKKDACMAALVHNCVAMFTHNGSEYRVDVSDLVNCVKQQE